jgi:hypothetical protein
MAKKTRTTVGGKHAPSIKNPAVYEALVNKEGMSKGQAARISNAALRNGAKKGRRSPKRK